jgi:hypothetical protein
MWKIAIVLLFLTQIPAHAAPDLNETMNAIDTIWRLCDEYRTTSTSTVSHTGTERADPLIILRTQSHHEATASYSKSAAILSLDDLDPNIGVSRDSRSGIYTMEFKCKTSACVFHGGWERWQKDIELSMCSAPPGEVSYVSRFIKALNRAIELTPPRKRPAF